MSLFADTIPNLGHVYLTLRHAKDGLLSNMYGHFHNVSTMKKQITARELIALNNGIYSDAINYIGSTQQTHWYTADSLVAKDPF